MNSSLATTLNSLDLPALGNADVTAIKDLQHEWERHSERMLLLNPERIAGDRKRAYNAFLADPSEENEERLAVLADEGLTARRYALLHEAYAELRRRCSEKTVAILEPVLGSLRQALSEALAAREVAVKAEELNKRTDARCLELREALDRITHESRVHQEATSIAPIEELSPLRLAALLLTDDEGVKAA